MRKGGGGQKGAAFERGMCKRLSLWVSHGKREDLFWRSSMSGGRATVMKRRGITLAAQAGDIVAVDKAGQALTADFYFELKHVKNYQLDSFITKNTGRLAAYWYRACQEASEYGKSAVLIARQNQFPTIVVCGIDIGNVLTDRVLGIRRGYRAQIFIPGERGCEIWWLDKLLSLKFAYRGK